MQHADALLSLVQQLVGLSAQPDVPADRGTLIEAALDHRATDYLEDSLGMDLGTLQEGRGRKALDETFGRWATHPEPFHLPPLEEGEEEEGLTDRRVLASAACWILERLGSARRRDQHREPWQSDPDEWRE